MKHTVNLFLFFSLIATGIVSNLIPGLVTELQAAESVSMSNKFTTLNQTIDAHAKEAAKLTKELTGAIERARKIESPDEAQIQANDTLEKAKNWLIQVNTSIETTRAYLNTLINAEKIKTSAEKSLAKTSEASQLKSLDRLSVDELNNLNNQIVLDLENERNRRNTLEAQLNKLSDRREIMVAEISQFSNRQASLKQPATVDASGKPKNGTQPGGQDLIKSIETLFINQKRLELEWEQRSFDIRRSILRDERQLTEKNVFNFEKNAAVIQEALNLARTKAATASISSAETSSKKFSSSHPVLQEVLNTNQKLAAETAEISVTITALSVDKHTIEQDLDRYQQSFNTIKDKISSAGLSETIGIRLRNAKNQLPDLSAFTQRIEKRRSVIEEVQLRRIDLEDRSLELVNIPREVNNRLSTVVFTDELTRKQTKQQLELLLNEQKNQFLANALKTYDNYFEKTLVPLFEKEKEYVKLINDYTTYINERILWVKSSQIITPNDFIQSLKSLLWLITPSSWVTVISNLIEIADNNLFYTIIVSLLFVATFFVRPFLVRQMKYYGRYKTKLSLAKFSDSLMAGLLTLLLAAYWPLLLWLIALSILNSQTAEVFTRAVAEGLLASANVLFFVFLFMQIVRGSGLAESHFRWKATTISLIKKQLLWFGALIIPFVFILQTTNNQPIQTHFDTLGRLAFIAITLLLTILIYRLVNPKKGIFKDELQQHKDGWLNRTRYIWLPLTLTLPLVLSVTAIAGYLYTATELMLLLITSFWVIVAAMILHEFLIRWLNIAQRKLTMEQIRKKIASQSESDQPAPTGDLAGTQTSEESEVDLGHISLQTLKLLNNFTGFAIIIGLYLLWVDIFPALNMLDSIALWESDSKSADGQIISTTITLGNGLTALAILIITTLIGANIPGLLEIAILQRLPFSPSARYGITTIARYIIVIIGTLLTFGAIGIGWAKVQWLAAAVTVGLGFGLQEIFANFVSGIIILIERQIRVGDAITVGDISGRVSRIKMRATTVIDWDRKELIIPNKEFVTGQVINWTLSDTIIRLVIPVGIAYGSDTKKAHDILLSLAEKNELILDDPAPEAFFSGFGDSTLDFELRVFLPTSDLRISMRHDLLMQIDQAFREANIEIAFPQRDIHIRSMPESFISPLKNI